MAAQAAELADRVSDRASSVSDLAVSVLAPVLVASWVALAWALDLAALDPVVLSVRATLGLVARAVRTMDPEASSGRLDRSVRRHRVDRRHLAVPAALDRRVLVAAGRTLRHPAADPADLEVAASAGRREVLEWHLARRLAMGRDRAVSGEAEAIRADRWDRWDRAAI